MPDVQAYPESLRIIPAPLPGLPNRVRLETGEGREITVGVDYAQALEKAARAWRTRPRRSDLLLP